MNISTIKNQLTAVKDFFQKPQTKRAMIITGIALLAIGTVAGLIATAVLVPGAAPIMAAIAIRTGIAIGVGVTVGLVIGVMKASFAR
jgi:hypothetical protein